jgi:hypothetical protein
MPDLYLPPLCTIHPWSPEAMGPQLNAWNLGISNGGTGSLAWFRANMALFIPFKLTNPTTAKQLFIYNGATASGNVDVGLYTEAGVRLTSAGSTAQAGTNALQVFDIPDVTLGPGRFYLAMALNNTTGTVFRNTLGNAGQGNYLGMLKQDSAFPLPATATFATLGTDSARLPIFGLTTRSLI